MDVRSPAEFEVGHIPGGLASSREAQSREGREERERRKGREEREKREREVRMDRGARQEKGETSGHWMSSALHGKIGWTC